MNNIQVIYVLQADQCKYLFVQVKVAMNEINSAQRFRFLSP